MTSIRQPIIAVLGHVDHGKTLLLDKIRGSAIASKEAGGITQSIGASILSKETIMKLCGTLFEKFKVTCNIPGILFIDTPGHAAFVNLRKRGSSIADIAVLVIDINEGIMPQTEESIAILKQTKTPFIIAANKIDLLQGWRQKAQTFLESFKSQQQEVQTLIETKIYELVGKLSEFGYKSERYDRIENFTKQVTIVPISAKTGEGIPELLLMIVGMAQKYLEEALKTQTEGPAKATVLEVKKAKGIGTIFDTILYDGTLSVNDTVVIGTLEKPLITRVKALYQPAIQQEMRDSKTKFISVKKVYAATGVRISTLETQNVIAGMPMLSGTIETAVKIIEQEIKETQLPLDTEGIIVKADTLGALEAFVHLLRERQIKVVKASIGEITKKDILDAEAAAQREPLNGMLLCFNVSKPEELPQNVTAIANNVVYRLIEEYIAWKQEKIREAEKQRVDNLKPCKIQLLKGHLFRQSNPAVVGVEVIGGTLRPGKQYMNVKGIIVSIIKEVQKEQKNAGEAKKGEQAAISLPDAVIGRNLKETETLYSEMSENEFRQLKDQKEFLTNDEKEVLKEIAEIKRKENPVWGV